MALEQADRYLIRNRYLFQGRLVLQTALHIGGGRGNLSGSNSPVILTPEEIPFIPGSSFKGALRSTVEKFVPSLSTELFTCALQELSPAALKEAKEAGERICSSQRYNEIVQRKRENPANGEAILKEARAGLCHTCQLFGSTLTAARLAINDLYIPSGEWQSGVQTRDGVAIDRDSEKARDRLKYDYEVVPASAAFALEITLENATPVDLQLLSLGLSEFVAGFTPLGGKRSRGLGACRLEDLQVYALELIGQENATGRTIDASTRNKRLRAYLLGKERAEKFPSPEDGPAFLERQIAKLLS